MYSKSKIGEQNPQMPQEISEVGENLNAKLITETLPGKMLLAPATILSKKPTSKWKDRDVLPITKFLAGRNAIDGTGENLEGANAFANISQDLTTYILEHSKNRAMTNFVYVVIDLSSPNALPTNLNLYPPAGSPHPVLIPFAGTNHIFVFNGTGSTAAAQHFIGWLQGSQPGIRAFVFHTSCAATFY
ncbi:18252_t:CDS:2 [Funneliformis geosporum]|uniref:11543_t:CDS:1 n=1 Tax=Funneliformis geosporum TaxID=1117311 RepID=A0A9W4SLP1_9GLOM|nr:11543_t:CDS:2 [Funneliformis geosporum]CAI2173206.1 18252_t:CDS:2 [Funneliformis geosporum]